MFNFILELPCRYMLFAKVYHVWDEIRSIAFTSMSQWGVKESISIPIVLEDVITVDVWDVCVCSMVRSKLVELHGSQCAYLQVFLQVCFFYEPPLLIWSRNATPVLTEFFIHILDDIPVRINGFYCNKTSQFVSDRLQALVELLEEEP